MTVRRLIPILTGLMFLPLNSAASAETVRATCPASRLRFEISFPAQQSATALNGRLYLMLSTDDKSEPRFEISDDPDTQQFFGVDVDGLTADKPAVVDSTAVGYLAESLACIPAGDYYVQALLNLYQT